MRPINIVKKYYTLGDIVCHTQIWQKQALLAYFRTICRETVEVQFLAYL